MFDKYRDYFDIDPEYFPQVNKELIDENPELWKKFYPHETFVKMLKDIISILSRKQKVSLWVEGAYGTGKSHAVLTMKKLLEVSEEETKEYFDRFSNILSNDLFNSLWQIKNSGKKLLIVHRYGSSNINGDADLCFLIQKSIAQALEENGLKGGDNVLRNKWIEYLQQDWVKHFFTEERLERFDGDDISQITENLQEFEGDALQSLMSQLMDLAKQERLPDLQMTTDNLIAWIEEIIKINDLKAIAFIWDEFTEFFKNNARHLTGFQQIVDLSSRMPFYMIIVTHNVTHIFPEGDKDWKKIMDRFINPICNIELPENMAFKLMGQAMQESRDEEVREDWHDTRDGLYERTHESRVLVKKKANIDDTTLKSILPIHPYAALLLKYISSAFDSNQRSMFDFIKNDRGDEIQGFQYFIDHNGPDDDNPYLTVDMLWDFFYEKGKEFLSHDIRTILDCFPLSKSKNLDENEERVLKTILLLQAISQRTGNTVDLFIPDERNLDNAFDGTDLENDEANKIARSLCRNEVIFKRPLPGGKEQYSAMINATNTDELKNKIEEQRKKDTTRLIDEAKISEFFTLKGALGLRYQLHFVSSSNFKLTINRLNSDSSKLGNKIVTIVALAKDDQEAIAVNKQIEDAIQSGEYSFVFIDASLNPLGNDLLDQYAEAMANSVINMNQDKGLAKQYERNAADALKKWCNKIIEGEFIVYDLNGSDERVNNIEQLMTSLERINRKKYPNGLETIGSVNTTMWTATSLKLGVECGVTKNVSGTYRSSNPETKLENYLGETWQDEQYWVNIPNHPVSKIKISIIDFIDKQFEINGQVSIKEIYNQLKGGKYGFMPCNLTAFVLGFLLKEYVNAGTYNYTDGTISETLSVDKLKIMIDEIIKNENTPISRYKDKYIGKMLPEEKAFIEASAKIFKLPLQNCATSEKTRDLIRQKMREFYFPIWVLKYNLSNEAIKANENDIKKIIDGFLGIANSGNFGKTDKEFALETGKLCMSNVDAVDDLALLMSSDKIMAGMEAYLHSYKDGVIINLANEVSDNGQYINYLKEKFRVNDANWVWNIDTANQKIDDLILEYRIIIASNKILPKNISYTQTIKEWCDCTKSIRISYQYAKNYWEELSALMAMLYEIKQSGRLSEDKRQLFLTLITTHGEAFKNFRSNQIDVFKKSCSFLLSNFENDDEKICDIFKRIVGECFTADKGTYQNAVENAIEKFKSEQGSEKMRELWREKTKSESPRSWSKDHKMPILCLVNDIEMQDARTVFNTLNNKNNSSTAIEKAIQFIESATFIQTLNDEAVIDAAFRSTIVKQYSVMFDDLDEVRSYLMNHLSNEPFDWWFNMPTVDKKLKEFAQYKYNKSGCDLALAKIDEMDVADVKQYLKELIRDNMTVGIEIIKGK